jgi:hypothetical protein
MEYQAALKKQIDEKKRQKDEEKRKEDEIKKQELDEFLQSQFRGKVPAQTKGGIRPNQFEQSESNNRNPPKNKFRSEDDDEKNDVFVDKKGRNNNNKPTLALNNINRSRDYEDEDGVDNSARNYNKKFVPRGHNLDNENYSTNANSNIGGGKKNGNIGNFVSLFFFCLFCIEHSQR